MGLLPQIYNQFKTQTAEGLSSAFLFLRGITTVCFAIYGFFISAMPVMIANIVVLMEVCVLGVQKLVYSKKPAKELVLRPSSSLQNLMENVEGTPQKEKLCKEREMILCSLSRANQ